MTVIIPETDLEPPIGTINEEFDDTRGRFKKYDDNDLLRQKHVDIRDFRMDHMRTAKTMLYLDQQRVGDLEIGDITSLEGTLIVNPGEQWNHGVCGPQADRINWQGLSLTCPAGKVSSSESVIHTTIPEVIDGFDNDLDQYQTDSPGKLIVANGVALPTSPIGETEMRRISEYTWSNMVVGIKHFTPSQLDPLGGYAIALLARTQDVNNTLVGYLNKSGDMSIQTRINGIVTTIASGSMQGFDPDKSYWVRLIVNGDQVTLEHWPSDPGLGATVLDLYNKKIWGTPGLVSYWRLGESTGPLQDSNGVSPGTVIGGTPTRNADGAIDVDPDGSISLDGVAAVDFGNDSSLDVGNEFSFEMWIYRYDDSPASQTLVSNGAWKVLLENSHVAFYGSGGLMTDSTIALTSYQWHHIVVVKTEYAAKIYINGQDVTGAVANQILGSPTHNLTIGQGDGGTYFNGRMDEVALYNRALVVGEIQYHWSLGSVLSATRLTTTLIGTAKTALGAGVRGTGGFHWWPSSLIGYPHLDDFYLKPYDEISTSASDSLKVVDLERDFEDDDFVSMALPDFPRSAVDIDNSFLDFTSHPDGDFTQGPTSSIALSYSVTPLVDGDSEFRIRRDSFVNINLSNITGVRLRIKAVSNCIVRILAIRLLDKNWKYTRMDINTLENYLVHPVSRTGSLEPSFEIEYPHVVYRSEVPSGPMDPRPINMIIESIFHIGSEYTTGLNNVLSFRVRQRGEGETIQLDLDGYYQGQLESINHQPDYGQDQFIGRPQSEIDTHSQAELDLLSQDTLDKIVNELHEAYIEISLSWGPDPTSIFIREEHTPPDEWYFFYPSLGTERDYGIRVFVKDNQLRCVIYNVDNGVFTTTVYDTGTIEDEFMFRRRKGRVGYGMSFTEGDSYVSSFRAIEPMFGEIITQGYQSLTPVQGAQLYAASTNKRELFTGFSDLIGSTVSIDYGFTNSSDGSFKVQGSNQIGGAISNKFHLVNPHHTTLEFDIYATNEVLYPLQAITFADLSNTNDLLVGFRAFLMDDKTQRIVELSLTNIESNKWTRVEARIQEAIREQTGDYRFALLSLSTSAVKWWIDNVTIGQRTVSWSGRGQSDDPWHQRNPAWTEYGDFYNSDVNGALFAEMGKNVQIRGLALDPQAIVQKISFVPKYAELGGLIWEDPKPFPENFRIAVNAVPLP